MAYQDIIRRIYPGFSADAIRSHISPAGVPAIEADIWLKGSKVAHINARDPRISDRVDVLWAGTTSGEQARICREVLRTWHVLGSPAGDSGRTFPAFAVRMATETLTYIEALGNGHSNGFVLFWIPGTGAGAYWEQSLRDDVESTRQTVLRKHPDAIFL